MRPDYSGVKFYSVNDWSIGWALEKAEHIIFEFNADDPIADVNTLLELFNVQKLFECGVRLNKWSDAEYNQFKSKAKSIQGVLGKYFSQIDDSNFIDNYKNVYDEYVDDFWELFEKYKCYKKVSSERFEESLLLRETPLYRLFSHKEIVNAYNTQLAKELRISDQTCELLVSQV